jgi:hypothetical protein
MFRPHEAIISPNHFKEITTLQALKLEYDQAVIVCRRIWEIYARTTFILKLVLLKFIFSLQYNYFL